MLVSKSLSRRTFLRGTGVALGLPMLEAMTVSAKPAQTEARRPVRFITIYSPNGMNMRDWTPTATGAEFEFTPILKPLERYRANTLVLSTLRDDPAHPYGDGAGDNSRAAA